MLTVGLGPGDGHGRDGFAVGGCTGGRGSRSPRIETVGTAAVVGFPDGVDPDRCSLEVRGGRLRLVVGDNTCNGRRGDLLIVPTERISPSRNGRGSISSL